MAGTSTLNMSPVGLGGLAVAKPSRAPGLPLLVASALALVAALVPAAWSPATSIATTRAVDSRASDAGASSVATGTRTAAPFDVNAVADQVRHRLVPSAGEPGSFTVDDATYRASIHADGFDLALAGGSTVGLSLRSAHRDGVTTEVPRHGWSASANRATRPVGEGLTEQITARGGEVQWDVVLGQEPAGEGPLQLNADLRGVRSASTQPAADPRVALGLDGAAADLSELVVVDATGREIYRALPRVNGTQLQLEVPASVLDGARYPLVVDPTISPAVPVSAPSGLPYGQFTPSVATDGSIYLVAWRDDFTPRELPANRIQATRVTRQGVVLDPGGILVHQPPSSIQGGGESLSPSVAYAGGNFLVVWEASEGGDFPHIDGARVSPSGTLVDSSAIPISGDTGRGNQQPAVAASADAFLVVWQHLDGDPQGPPIGYDIMAATLSGPRGGTTVGPPRVVTDAANDQTTPAVAWSGQDFFVAWADRSTSSQPDIRGTLVTGAGVPDSSILTIEAPSGNQEFPTVASAGANGVFLVAWQADGSGNFNIRGRQVGRFGPHAATFSNAFPISTAADNQSLPSAGYDGTNFVVAWRDRRGGAGLDIYGARVGAQATANPPVLDPSGILLSNAVNDQSAPAVVGNPDGGAFVVWDDARLRPTPPPNLGYLDIWGAQLRGNGTVVDPAGYLISVGNQIDDPGVGFNGTEYLVAWGDNRSGDGDVIATRVLPDGQVLDPEGIRLYSNYVAPNNGQPAVVSDGQDFLVAFQTFPLFAPYLSNVGVRVASGGSVLGQVDLGRASFSAAPPAVAFNGTNYLSVPNEGDATFEGRVISKTGTLVRTFEIAPGFQTRRDPAVASADGKFLVLWHEDVDGSVHAALATAGGAVTSASGFPLAGGRPSVAGASDGAGYLVARETGFGILGTRVSSTGTVLDANVPLGEGNAPAVAFNGAWLVAWTDRRSTGPGPGIYGRRVRTDGTVVDDSPFAIAPGIETAPGLSPGSGNRWSVVYADQDARFKADRIYFRTVAPK